jgi:hypothetical protein
MRLHKHLRGCAAARRARRTGVDHTRTLKLGLRPCQNCKPGQDHLPDPAGDSRPQAQVRLDARELSLLAVAYRNGKARRELTSLFGIHRATVTAVLQRLGVEPRIRGLPDEQVAEACRLYPEGGSLARVAVRYDVTDMTVGRCIYFWLAAVSSSKVRAC